MERCRFELGRLGHYLLRGQSALCVCAEPLFLQALQVRLLEAGKPHLHFTTPRPGCRAGGLCAAGGAHHPGHRHAAELAEELQLQLASR